MSEREEYDSDAAPEEFTAEQGLQLDEQIRKSRRENKARVARDTKERRRKWAQNKTPKTPRTSGGEIVQDANDREINQEYLGTGGMLSDDIVKLLAAREKQVFLSDSEDEKVNEKPARKKKAKSLGPQTVILKNMPSGQCLENSLDFLKKRKMQVPRSNSVLNNSNQALRFLSTSGLLK